MRDESLVFEKSGYLKNVKRKRNVYFLTTDGLQKGQHLYERIKTERLAIKDSSGNIEKIRVDEALKSFNYPLLELVAKIDEQGILDPSLLKPMQTAGSGALAKLVGRKDELAKLRQYLEGASAGKGELVFIQGEAGIGKTRLLEEFLATLSSDDAIMLKGRCLHHEGADPYLPFLEILRSHYKSVEVSTGIKEFDPLSTGFTVMGDPSEELRNLKAEDVAIEHTRMFEAIVHLLLRIPEKKPLILILEDIHWADEGTIHLTNRLARELSSSRILLCCTLRPEEMAPGRGSGPKAFVDLMHRLRYRGLVKILPLSRFTVEEAEELAKSILCCSGISKGFLLRLYDETEGNPLFIQEVLLSIIQSHDSPTVSCDTDLAALESIPIPQTIKGIVDRRINRLSQEARKIIECASVVGNDFNFDVVLKASLLDDEAVMDAFDELSQARLINEDPDIPESFHFNHAKILDVVYAGTSSYRKRALHRKAGEAIESFATESADIYDLARHFTRGGEYEKGLKYSLDAGRKSIELFAMDQAVSYYRMALSNMEELSDDATLKRTKLTVIENLGLPFYLMGKWEDALQNAKDAIRLSQELGDFQQELDSTIYLGEIYEKMSRWEEAISSLKTALSMSEEVKHNREIAKANRGLGRVFWRMGKYEKAVAHYYTSQIYYGKLRETRGLGQTLIELGSLYKERGELEIAEDHYLNSLKHLDGDKDRYDIARAYNNLGVIYSFRDMWAEAVEHYESCCQLAKKVGYIRAYASSCQGIGEVYAKTGRTRDAMSLLNEACAIFEELEDNIGLAYTYMDFGIVYKYLENWDNSEKFFKNSLDILKKLKTPYILGEAYIEYGQMLLARGDTDSAGSMFKRAEKCLMGIESTPVLTRKIEKLRQLENFITT